MTELSEPLRELFSRSRLMILNFSNIPSGSMDFENISVYFKELEASGQNPRLPENRQAFNNRFLDETGSRYLVSQYGEDRVSMLSGSSIANEGRTIHLGIDIFTRDLEPVLSPCRGTIVKVGREVEEHSFGNYLILKPEDTDLPLFFFGHLSNDLPSLGPVGQGQPIAMLGDYKDNENGGWSRHLHLQCLTKLPSDNQAPVGYGHVAQMNSLKKQYPDPMQYFPAWNL